MAENFRVTLTKEEFERYEVHYPSNYVIVEMEPRKDILVAGIKVNFNEDTLYGEGNESHVADMAPTHGVIVKQVEKLYYNRKDIAHSMSWKTDLATSIGDTVFFHHLISKNCSEVVVEDKVYKVIPYEDLFVAKRGKKVVCLNGNVILQTVYKPKVSQFDITEPEIDKFKGIVNNNGSNNIEYQTKGLVDFKGLKVGDMVLIDKNSYPFYLERSRYNSSFDSDTQYLCCQKKHIIAVL